MRGCLLVAVAALLALASVEAVAREPAKGKEVKDDTFGNPGLTPPGEPSRFDPFGSPPSAAPPPDGKDKPLKFTPVQLKPGRAEFMPVQPVFTKDKPPRVTPVPLKPGKGDFIPTGPLLKAGMADCRAEYFEVLLREFAKRKKLDLPAAPTRSP